MLPQQKGWIRSSQRPGKKKGVETRKINVSGGGRGKRKRGVVARW